MKLIKPENRFWAKVRKTESCWVWLGYISKPGYGQIRINKKNYRVHRISWELKNGKILSNLLVLHKCDVRNCVNPEHLFLGTQQDNLKDMRKKGRGRGNKKNCPKGHLFDEKNTYKYRGSRICRKCSHSNSILWRKNNREKYNARERAWYHNK